MPWIILLALVVAAFGRNPAKISSTSQKTPLKGSKMNSSVYALSKNGITSLTLESTVPYMRTTLYPNASDEAIIKSLDTYDVTSICCELRVPKGAKVAKDHGEVSEVLEETKGKRTMYYLVAPRITDACVIQE